MWGLLLYCCAFFVAVLHFPVASTFSSRPPCLLSERVIEIPIVVAHSVAFVRGQCAKWHLAPKQAIRTFRVPYGSLPHFAVLPLPAVMDVSGSVKPAPLPLKKNARGPSLAQLDVAEVIWRGCLFDFSVFLLKLAVFVVTHRCNM